MTTTTSRFSTPARWLLAGPLAVVVAVAVLAGMPVWLPPGPSQIDHVLFALLLFPAVWGGAFFYALLAEKLSIVSVIFLLITLVNVGFALSSGGWT